MTDQPTTRVARLRRFAIASLAAATVAGGTLAVPAPASALPMGCDQAWGLARIYFATANVFKGLGDTDNWRYWRSQATAVLAEYCGLE